jgi:hypothetical protein
MNEKSAISKKIFKYMCVAICKIVSRIFFANKLLMMMMKKGLSNKHVTFEK